MNEIKIIKIVPFIKNGEILILDINTSVNTLNAIENQVLIINKVYEETPKENSIDLNTNSKFNTLKSRYQQGSEIITEEVVNATSTNNETTVVSTPIQRDFSFIAKSMQNKQLANKFIQTQETKEEVQKIEEIKKAPEPLIESPKQEEYIPKKRELKNLINKLNQSTSN